MLHNGLLDLLDEKVKPAMGKLVDDYVQKHLKIAVDGKLVPLKFLGFEKIDEGIYSYYQADNITNPKKIEVTDNVLLEYNEQQMNIVHVIVDGNHEKRMLDLPKVKKMIVEEMTEFLTWYYLLPIMPVVGELGLAV